MKNLLKDNMDYLYVGLAEMIMHGIPIGDMVNRSSEEIRSFLIHNHPKVRPDLDTNQRTKIETFSTEWKKKSEAIDEWDFFWTDDERATYFVWNFINNFHMNDNNGNPYGISSMVGQEIVNPVAFMKTQRGNFGWSDDFVANLFIEANIISGLKFRTNFGGKKAFYGNEYFSPKHYLNASSNSNRNSLTRNEGKAFDWIISNTLTYTKQIKDHSFTILLGQEVNELNVGTYTTMSHSNLPTNNYQDASFNFEIPPADRTGSTSTNVPHKLTSLFTRLNYDFKEKYLFRGISRQDGSSRFGRNEKYGYFPSVSLGWVVSKEDCWNPNSYVNSLKLKGFAIYNYFNSQ